MPVPKTKEFSPYVLGMFLPRQDRRIYGIVFGARRGDVVGCFTALPEQRTIQSKVHMSPITFATARCESIPSQQREGNYPILAYIRHFAEFNCFGSFRAIISSPDGLFDACRCSKLFKLAQFEAFAGPNPAVCESPSCLLGMKIAKVSKISLARMSEHYKLIRRQFFPKATVLDGGYRSDRGQHPSFFRA